MGGRRPLPAATRGGSIPRIRGSGGRPHRARGGHRPCPGPRDRSPSPPGSPDSAEQLRSDLAAIDGVEVHDGGTRRVGHRHLHLGHAAPGRVPQTSIGGRHQRLGERGPAARLDMAAPNPTSVVRASPHYYNTESRAGPAGAEVVRQWRAAEHRSQDRRHRKAGRASGRPARSSPVMANTMRPAKDRSRTGGTCRGGQRLRARSRPPRSGTTGSSEARTHHSRDQSTGSQWSQSSTARGSASRLRCPLQHRSRTWA